MIGLFYLLFFYFLGQCASRLIGGFIPGSILGMLLLFAALCLKIIKAEDVKGAAQFLLNNIVLFFVPISVGLMTSYTLISEHLYAIIVSCVVSTILIISVVGWFQQFQEKQAVKRNKTPKSGR